MKEMMLKLILATLAFALPSLAETYNWYCAAYSVEKTGGVYFSKVFVITSTTHPTYMDATQSNAFRNYAEATSDEHPLLSGGCHWYASGVEARTKKSEEMGFVKRLYPAKVIREIGWPE